MDKLPVDHRREIVYCRLKELCWNKLIDEYYFPEKGRVCSVWTGLCPEVTHNSNKDPCDPMAAT